jgi:5'-3' exonuclease
MGIPYYVASLIRSHKHIQQKCGNAPLDVDVLGIDFNCFIHRYLRADNPIGSLVVALHELLTKTVRAKKVYIAFDGLVPYAKMVQQRYRRMRRGDTGEFDKHQISPGTPFMKKLAATLRFIFPEATTSCTLERGEGEHKIFTWLQGMNPDQRKTICVYGLDADLVLISLAQSKLGDIQLLREMDDKAGNQLGFSTLSVTALSKVLPLDLDSYIKMSILNFGNDFMPNIGMFSLREDGYPRAIYHATHATATGLDEKKTLMKRAKDSDRKIVSADGHAMESRVACHLMDGVVNWEPVCYAFWKTYAWTYHYFTTSEVLDWEWYYPYPEAPMLQTMEEYEKPTEFV